MIQRTTNMAAMHVSSEAGDRINVNKIIETELKKRGKRRDIDVIELYLSNSGLTKVPDLLRFKNLQRLWLSENRIEKLTDFRAGCSLTELYLQDNALKKLNGSLQSLRCIEILLLQNNQLTGLVDVIFELRKMKYLRILNLFGNPVAQEPNYRDYTIYSLPSVDILDRQAVTKEDRYRVASIYDEKNQAVRDSIAFGRGVTSLRDVCYTVPPHQPIPDIWTGETETSKEDLTMESTNVQSTTPVINQKRRVKQMTTAGQNNDSERLRSLTQFTAFGWIDILKARQEEQSQGVPKSKPVIYVSKFR